MRPSRLRSFPPSIRIAPQSKIFKQHHPITEIFRPTMPFSDFVTPPPRTPFTRDFFYSLTFNALADVRLRLLRHGETSYTGFITVTFRQVTGRSASTSMICANIDFTATLFVFRGPDCTVIIEEAGAIFLVLFYKLPSHRDCTRRTLRLA